MRPQHIFFSLTLFCFLLSCKPTNEQLLHKANALAKEGKYEKAIEICTAVIKRDNKLQQAWYDRGVAYQAIKKYNLALGDLNTVLVLKADTSYANGDPAIQVPFADAFFQRAQVKFYVDSLESAFSDFQILIGGDYKKGSCLLWQGAIYVKRGQIDAACKVFKEAKQFAATDVEIRQSNEATNVYCGE
jgi:tetratricopeptide (TPR) repeat protein